MNQIIVDNLYYIGYWTIDGFLYKIAEYTILGKDKIFNRFIFY